MKHTTLWMTILVCVLLSGASVVAKGPQEGKGGKGQKAMKGTAQKAEKEADNPAEKARKAAKERGEKEATAVKGKAEKKNKEAKAKGEKKAEDMKAKGKDKALKDAPIAEQIQHEDQKHATRQARLEKLHAKATADGDEKMVQRIEKLMEKEQRRYQKKHQKMKQRQVGEKKTSSKEGDND